MSLKMIRWAKRPTEQDSHSSKTHKEKQTQWSKQGKKFRQLIRPDQTRPEKQARQTYNKDRQAFEQMGVWGNSADKCPCTLLHPRCNDDVHDDDYDDHDHYHDDLDDDHDDDDDDEVCVGEDQQTNVLAR